MMSTSSRIVAVTAALATAVVVSSCSKTEDMSQHATVDLHHQRNGGRA